MPYTHAWYYISCRNLTLCYYPDGAEVGDSSLSTQRHLACCGAEHPTASQGACARGSRRPRRVRWELLGSLHRRARAGAGGARSPRKAMPEGEHRPCSQPLCWACLNAHPPLQAGLLLQELWRLPCSEWNKCPSVHWKIYNF